MRSETYIFLIEGAGYGARGWDITRWDSGATYPIWIFATPSSERSRDRSVGALEADLVLHSIRVCGA